MESVRKILEDVEKLQAEVYAFLKIGKEDLNLEEWITIKEYVKRHNLSGLNVVHNWIKRGVVPPENLRRISQLNDIQLIKDVVYKEDPVLN